MRYRSKSMGFPQQKAKLKNVRKWPRKKASAAVTAIGLVKAPEQKNTKLNNCDAEKFWPEMYTGDRVDKKSFAEFLVEVETYLSVLAPGLLARPLLEGAAAFRDDERRGSL